mgnify:CR=1 FL=1|tara:strand:+ start:420 stop:1391 length:972 start_codon:yes stop_codon:yes gene_type:complete
MKYDDKKITLRTMSLRVIACTTFVVIFYLIGIPNILLAESENETTENRMLFGRYKEVSGKININVICEFGIEQWIDNKKDDDYLQVWNLYIASNNYTILDANLSISEYGLYDKDSVLVRKYWTDTVNKLLTIEELYFKNGTLRFEFKYSEIEDPVSVNIRFIADNGFLYLTKFKALSTTSRYSTTDMSTELIIKEYKIPEYTYIKNVPVKMTGYKTIEQKAIDEMFSSFSDNDKAVFKKLAIYVTSEGFWSEAEKRIEKLFPDYTLEDIDSGKIQLEDAEITKLFDLFTEAIHEYCVKEGMSKEAIAQTTKQLDLNKILQQAK